VSELPPAAAIVLAAGGGTRMRSGTPKVLHTMCGRSLLGHVLAATDRVRPETTLVVVGAGRDAVERTLREHHPAVSSVVQLDQRGTGHALRLALQARPELAGTLLVLPGDAPLLTGETLGALLSEHSTRGNAATLLTAEVPDPSGYGRVVRSGGAVTAVVEHRDATSAEVAISEVATSVYAFEVAVLREALDDLGADNDQGEEYLTDVVGLLSRADLPVGAVLAPDWHETVGVNDRLQLATARALMRDRLLRHWMLGGVTVTDPRTTWLGVDVTFEPDSTVHQNTQLHGRTHLSSGAVIGPNVTLRDTWVGPAAHVINATCTGAEIGPEASVGPYTFLRPGTRLGPRAKAGGFVEVKAAEIGADSKVPHLSYVGDATIGERSNVGAATIFVNYDGREKHHTVVGDDVRIGSDTMLVAPVRVGDRAYTAAGSVIVNDVPAGALGVGRARQRNIEGWTDRKRGTQSAEHGNEQGAGQ